MDNLFRFIDSKRLLYILLLLVVQQAYGQAPLLRGKVVDSTTGQSVQEATVRLVGKNISAMTDSEGNFSLSIPDPRSLVLISVTHLSYARKEISVNLANTSFLKVMLSSATQQLEEVRVDVSRRANTDASVLSERKRSGVIQDAISAQQIERTASITTTQALQRVTGVTITDDKYVAIRGLGDRSVIGQLNGARLSSSNPDRSAIPLDLVPAALLDNITVLKSFTPDKPADASAGIVELKTKSIPDKLTLEVSAQTGVNTNVGLGGSYNSFENNGIGFFGTKINDKNLSSGFLELSEKYPDGLASIQRLIANQNLSDENYKEVNRINGLMKSFDQTMTTRFKKAAPNQQYAINFGNKYGLFGGKHTLGVILGANYYRQYADSYQGKLNQYTVYQGVLTGNADIYSPRNVPAYITPNNLNLGRYQTYNENTGNETLNYGVLGGLGYRFSPKHEIGIQYLGSWGAENQASNMQGKYDYTDLPGAVNSDINSLKQTFRKMHALNVQGDHKLAFSDWEPRLRYAGSLSRSTHNDPDYRYTSLATYIPDDSSEERKYALTSGYVNGYGSYGVIQAEPNGRRWRFLEEDNYNYKIDLDLPFSWLDTQQWIKVGFNYLYRKRNYTENHLFIPGSNFTSQGNRLLYEVGGNIDALVSDHIIGIQDANVIGEGGVPVNGFLYNILKSPNNYKGFYETVAWYAMADLRLSDDWRLTGGVRLESTDIASVVDTSNVFLDPNLMKTNEDGTKLPLLMIDPNSRYNPGYKPFYSVNLVYTLNENMNFRTGYNTTLSRPELREITNVFEYDAFQMGLVVGNPDLKNQTTQSADFRWEWFPSSGEVIAISAFGKRIHNQLVKVYSLRTEGLAATYPEYPIIQFQNEANVGKVWGVEVEVVKNLGNIWQPLNQFSLGTNVMIAQSDIKKSADRYQASHSLDRNATENSPLFEQAPYSINAWLNFNHKDWGTELTGNFNMVGERLVQINLLGEPDLYSRPYALLDFVLSQKVDKHFKIKAFAKNVLNPTIKTVYANPETGGKWHGNEYIQRSYKRGAEIMLGLSYNLF